jgi:transcriptional regulator with XRE-family HTH domain
MIVRKLRLQRGWSQEQLAEMAGLSIRTIQFIERGQKAGLESIKSLAAVFEVEFSNLSQETEMHPPQTITSEEQMALEYVREIKGF